MSASSEIIRILNLLESGASESADELLPAVYDELRKLAAAKLLFLVRRCWPLALVFSCAGLVQPSSEVAARTQEVELAVNRADLAMVKAEIAPIVDESSWESAAAQIQRVKDILARGRVHDAMSRRASKQLEEIEFKQNERQISVQIDEVVIQGATNPDLSSWRDMEKSMRGFFGRHGFDLDNTSPAEIGRRIRDDASSALWADLLELWIGTRSQMAAIGGPKLTAATTQPWADAIYTADSDPVRGGIRKFIYTPVRKRATLDRLVTDIDLKSLSARTLSWLATYYDMVQAHDESDRIFEEALMSYPRDLMLAHDYGYALCHQERYQESARMHHRCLAIRNDVPGIWMSLGMSLEKLGEDRAAQRAMKMSQDLYGEKTDSQ